MKYLDSVLSFVAPHHCLNCLKEGSSCCQKCLDHIADSSDGTICYRCNKSASSLGICKVCRPKQHLDSVNWYADYNDPLVSQLVKSLKFSNLYEASRPMSIALSSVLNLDTELFLVTSAPTAGRRSRARGWDQAKLIAKSYAKENRLKYKSLLIRTSSFDQIGATRSERTKASQRFFRPNRKVLIRNHAVILIDDIVTTGATLDSAAKELKSAGAKEVHGLVFARQSLKKNS